MSINIILWIIFGALAGWIANTTMKRNNQMGAIANIFLGIAGAAVGGFIMNLLGADGVNGFNLYILLVAVLSAAVLLFLVGMTQSDATL
jgi:uncharacterized membrane protein YeaQ/YmgE (transglycosylase-associated protein family)